MSGSVSMIDGHIDPDTNRMTDKESYPPLQYVDEYYNPIEITSKPTDKEIIQGLVCCKMPVGSGSCNDCPFDYQRKKRLTSTDKSCTTLMFDYALDLINRLQGKIDYQKAKINLLKDEKAEMSVDIIRQQAEIKRLTTLAKLGNMRADDYRAMRDKCKTARAEAIKEFAERLKNEKHICLPPDGYPINENDWVIYEADIDDLVKEMVGK